MRSRQTRPAAQGPQGRAVGEINNAGIRSDTETPGGTGVSPFATTGDSGEGVANPSAPTSGTEGWGTAPDERDHVRAPARKGQRKPAA